MIKAELDRQLMIHLKDTAGTLAEVLSVVSSSGINIVALCAYAIEGMVAIMFVSEDHNAAKTVLEKKGFDVQEEEVVLVTVENQPGALQAVTNKIAEEGIDLTLIYGSTDKDAERSSIVLISRNNLDVLMLIKMEMERG
ncbi:MAG: ACT domain-containing protein [Candidatus Omnitrophica bacterium]|nr:ACT domain-containing protein [Candidatus Omnitrophota bacterium]